MTTSEALRVLTRFRKWQQEQTACPPFDTVALACAVVVNALAIAKRKPRPPKGVKPRTRLVRVPIEKGAAV